MSGPTFSRTRMATLWYCRVRGRCICCGARVPRRGVDAQGICDSCLGVQRDPLGAYLTVEGLTYPLVREDVAK